MAEEGVVPSAVRSRKMPIFVFFKDSSLVFKMDSLGREILAIAIPAAMALAADPIASLIDTAFIGHIDSKTVACKSPSSISNISHKSNFKGGKRHIPSASTALIFGIVLGLLVTIFLISFGKPLLRLMGAKSGNHMLVPALKYLTIRSLGAPAVLLSLAMQGVFRGFKDTRTPLYAYGNEGREYVLRRILRPAVRYGTEVLKDQQGFFNG